MTVTYQAMKNLTAQLYNWSLRRIPEDTKDALREAVGTERSEGGRQVLKMMLHSAEQAESRDTFICSDAGVPVYFVKIGTKVTFDGPIKQAISDGFDELVATIDPPLLKHVTNPLTNERCYRGKDMPIVSYDLIDGADYVEIICQPKALGSGRWAAAEIFTFPSLEEIERYIMQCVLEAGSQHCPPVVVGVGIGGTFDHCAKIAKQATLRPLASINPEPILADMEARLTKAVNATGFGPMGTGGDTTTLGVKIEYAAGHGFTPVCVMFNCWINRRTAARLYNDGRVERLE